MQPRGVIRTQSAKNKNKNKRRRTLQAKYGNPELCTTYRICRLVPQALNAQRTGSVKKGLQRRTLLETRRLRVQQLNPTTTCIPRSIYICFTISTNNAFSVFEPCRSVHQAQLLLAIHKYNERQAQPPMTHTRVVREEPNYSLPPHLQLSLRLALVCLLSVQRGSDFVLCLRQEHFPWRARTGEGREGGRGGLRSYIGEHACHCH